MAHPKVFGEPRRIEERNFIRLNRIDDDGFRAHYT
jgi:hypothetical protein